MRPLTRFGDRCLNVACVLIVVGTFAAFTVWVIEQWAGH